MEKWEQQICTSGVVPSGGLSRLRSELGELAAKGGVGEGFGTQQPIFEKQKLFLVFFCFFFLFFLPDLPIGISVCLSEAVE